MAYIYNLTDTWNAAGTTFSGIKMAVTNTASSASSSLLDLSVSGATTASFVVSKIGQVSQSRTTGDNQAYRGFVNSTNNSYIRLENTTGSVDVVQSNAVASITVNNSNPLTFLVGGSERMRIDSAGNVGIGTASLTDRILGISKQPNNVATSYVVLFDAGFQSSTTNAQTFISSPGVASGASLNFLQHFRAQQGTFTGAVDTQYGFHAAASLTGATNNYGFFSNIASGTGRWNFYANGAANNYFAGRTIVGSSPTTITSSSGVTGWMQLVGTDVSQAALNAGRFSADAGCYSFYFSKSRGTTAGSNGIVSSGDFLGAMFFDGNDGTAQRRGATIAAIVDGAPGTNSMPTYISFSTTASGSTTPTERMRITSDGSVGIGATPPAATDFYIGANITGGTVGYANRIASFAQSDVTATANGFYSGIGTAAASFTLTNLIQFHAIQNTIGLGSTVTNSFGFYVNSNLTGATNNYGFYSNIASGTGRWNFYANGTANNYFAGNVGVGATSFGSSAVSVVSIGTGTAPTTGPADTIQLYSTDLSAGNTMLSLYTEGTPVNVNATAAATHRIAIRVNGTVYYLLANTSA